MSLRLAVGATPSVPGPSTSPPLFLTTTQRVHPPHLPSSPGPQLCTSNMVTSITTNLTNLTNKTKEYNRQAKHPQFPCSPLKRELVTWPQLGMLMILLLLFLQKQSLNYVELIDTIFTDVEGVD
jgi:hypothetical protein